MEGLIMAAQMFLGLSFLVGVHELGHLVAAKVFGMRVEKYSVGFPPKLFGVKLGETEYSFGALPIGGFVKISGMIDESLDKKHLGSEPQPWEFRSKPAWQRLIVMLGGIIVNIITGIAIFVGLVYFIGETYLSMDEVNKYGVYVTELGREIGLETGDKIVEVNGKEAENFSDIRDPNNLLETGAYYTVIRNDKRQEVPIPAGFLDRLSDKDVNPNFVLPLDPFKVGQVVEGSPADSAGLQDGDQIVTINGSPVKYFQFFREAVMEQKGQTIEVEVLRQSDESLIKDPIKLQINVSEEGRIGFYSQSLLERSTFQYSLSESLAKGTANAFGIIIVQVKAFSKFFTGELSVSKNLSGPVGVAQVFGGHWNWLRFWTLVGMLSMVLAFMNLLPIPALDGGHVVFITYEMVSGRPPSDRFLETAQRVGMVLLLGLMIFAFGNDIYKFFL